MSATSSGAATRSLVIARLDLHEPRENGRFKSCACARFADDVPIDPATGANSGQW